MALNWYIHSMHKFPSHFPEDRYKRLSRWMFLLKTLCCLWKTSIPILTSHEAHEIHSCMSRNEIFIHHKFCILSSLWFENGPESHYWLLYSTATSSLSGPFLWKFITTGIWPRLDLLADKVTLQNRSENWSINHLLLSLLNS